MGITKVRNILNLQLFYIPFSVFQWKIVLHLHA
jgi:hypothetical protein